MTGKANGVLYRRVDIAFIVAVLMTTFCAGISFVPMVTAAPSPVRSGEAFIAIDPSGAGPGGPFKNNVAHVSIYAADIAGNAQLPVVDISVGAASSVSKGISLPASIKPIGLFYNSNKRTVLASTRRVGTNAIAVYDIETATTPVSKEDPGNNNPPPAGAILDLSGTPIPGGGNDTYQQYSVDFTANAVSTAITFAFREDPAFISFADASVVDLTTQSGNLLTNGDFSGGTYTDNGNSLTPNGWIYANQYGAAAGGVVSSNCGVGANGTYGVGNCWFDGAVQAYDAISQTIRTTPQDIYRISFWVADNSGC